MVFCRPTVESIIHMWYWRGYYQNVISWVLTQYKGVKNLLLYFFLIYILLFVLTVLKRILYRFGKQKEKYISMYFPKKPYISLKVSFTFTFFCFFFLCFISTRQGCNLQSHWWIFITAMGKKSIKYNFVPNIDHNVKCLVERVVFGHQRIMFDHDV